MIYVLLISLNGKKQLALFIFVLLILILLAKGCSLSVCMVIGTV